ncbi:MAG TPA: antibiotic biosynthesis monooxygenase [Aliiroseovarius sp.]|nr:antibiotic biosynthesis monooxygenase [Aliiroseovarius sp.]
MDKQQAVRLKGILTVPADRLEAVRAALPEHIRLSRAEPGCIFFDVVEVADNDGIFNVSEGFVDQAAFDAHQRRTRASDWWRVTDGIPRTYTITKGRA